ncbi:MAG: hypothetical protein EBS53_07660 [Bacteroidetes bacterium]|nr:hypothetical protein [Bacteroidota bacterium]
MNGLLRTILLALLALDPWVVAHAQLADTIWAGDLPISSISFQQIEEGVLKYPAVSGGKMTVPVEIWFWDNGEVWLMFDNEKWGLTDRERTQIWLPQYPGSSRWEYTSSYSFSPGTKKGSLRGRSTRLKDSPWNYKGNFYAWSGSFAVAGSRMTVSKMVLTADSLVEILAQSDDPKNRPTGIKFEKIPTFGSLILQKTGQKPSQAVQGEDWN